MIGQHTAHWTDDCQGKKSFDGFVVLIDTRYWPRNYDRDGKPSAKSSIDINFKDEDGQYLVYGYGDNESLIEADFKADTEEEVKAQVEIWVQTQFERIVTALRKEFGREG